MQLSEAITSLLIATAADGGSTRTVSGYRQQLSALATFVGEEELVEEITADDLRRFIVHLRTRSTRYDDHPVRETIPGGLSTASIAAYIRSVKRLFNYLVDEGIISTSPARRLKGSKPPRGAEPKRITRDDFRRLMQSLQTQRMPETARIRNRAILLVLADTGCRRGGLVGMTLGDLDLPNGSVIVTEKGERTRQCYLSEPTIDALRSWLATRPDVPTDALFVSMEEGSGITGQTVNEILRRLKEHAGITGPCNPHAFRHGFAVEYLLDGGDMGSLADILGHQDVRTTWQNYAIFSTNELKSKHGKHSPVARMGREGEL